MNIIETIVEVNELLKNRVFERNQNIPTSDISNFFNILVEDIERFSNIFNDKTAIHISILCDPVQSYDRYTTNNTIRKQLFKQYSTLEFQTQHWSMSSMLMIEDEFDLYRDEIINKFIKESWYILYTIIKSDFEFVFREFLKRGYLFIILSVHNTLLIPLKCISSQMFKEKDGDFILDIRTSTTTICPITYQHKINNGSTSSNYRKNLKFEICKEYLVGIPLSHYECPMDYINTIDDNNEFNLNLWFNNMDLSQTLKQLILRFLT